MTGIYLNVSNRGNFDLVIDLPRQIQKVLWEILCRTFHERAIVCAGGKDADVIRVFIEDEAVHRRQPIEISFSFSFQLDVGDYFHFTARRTLQT